MKCPKCNAQLSDNAKFCTRCGTKINATPGKASFCAKCGAPLKEGAKFCSKCGNLQGAQNAQPVQVPQNVTVQQAPPKNAPKKKRKWPLVLLILFLIVALLVGTYFVLDKVFDINPIAWITGNKDDDESRDKEQSDSDDEDDEDSEDDGADTDSGDEKDEEEGDQPEEVDPNVVEELGEQIQTAQNTYDGGAYEDAVKESVAVINRYMTLSEDYVLSEKAVGQIGKAFNLASKAAIKYCEGIEKQEYGSAGYEQVHNTVDPILELGAALVDKGYEVDSGEITEFSAGIEQRFKDIYIKKINEITEREQWSRDEAWTYAQEAYSIQKGGKTVLFDENDLDDPLRLRYVYCLAWIQRKRCENGVADGSMTKEDAFNAMTAILEETDYNLLVLQDIITYGNDINEDISGYQGAYNAIVQALKDEQKLTIVNSGVNSGTSVDVRKFWYFNDLSGDDAYKVDINNGTTQATRDWIRQNIPSYID